MNEKELLILEAKKKIEELKEEITNKQAVLLSLVEQLNELENNDEE